MLLDRHGVLIHELRVVEHGRRLEWTQACGNLACGAGYHQFAPKTSASTGTAAWTGWRCRMPHSIRCCSRSRAAHRPFQCRSPRTWTLRCARPGRSARCRRSGTRSRRQRNWRSAWSKSQILEAYLNLSTFRGELQGIAAASRGLFGKSADGLDERESLLLAVLLRGPNSKPRKRRRNAPARWPGT